MLVWRFLEKIVLQRENGVFIPCFQQYRYLQVYLLLTVSMNLFCLFFNGYGGDLGYWNSWVKQLSSNGYEGFNGNYPPVYIHWLYLVGNVYVWLGVPIEKDLLLKFFVQLPIIASHYLFVIYAYYKLKRFGWSSPWFHLGLCIAAFSPAIFWNGPMWGQVDLLPIMLVVFAIESCFCENKRYQAMMIPLYVLSLLAKFQMIAFSPVIGFLFFRNIKLHSIGVLVATLLIVISFAPWLMVGEFKNAVAQAYIETLGQYPYATYNAANLWMLLVGNVSDDSRQMISLGFWPWLDKLGEVKYLGMLIFSIISLGVFIRGVFLVIRRCDAQRLHYEAFYSALVSALAFFTFLPAMHERYIFPAVVLSTVCALLSPRLLPLVIIISGLSAANMAVLLGINGSNMWLGMSSAVVVVTCFVLAGSFLSSRVKRAAWQILWGKVFALRYFAVLISLCLVFGVFSGLLMRSTVVTQTLNANERWLTSLPMIRSNQDHGRPKFNRSYSGGIISANGRRYANGIGSHSNSELVFELPENASTFSFSAGLDDGSRKADVQFIVKADGEVVWESDVVYASDWFSVRGEIDVSGVKELTLIIDKVTDDKWDHANWVNPIIILDEE